MEDKAINLKIQSRDGILFQGEITSLTAKNSHGTFDILKNHANFISLVGETLIIRDKEKIEREMRVENAILKAKENNVEIYVGVRS